MRASFGGTVFGKRGESLVECVIRDGCLNNQRMLKILKFTEVEFKTVLEMIEGLNIPEPVCYRLVKKLVIMGLLYKKKAFGRMFDYKNRRCLTLDDWEEIERLRISEHRKGRKNWNRDIADLLFEWFKKGHKYPVGSCIDYLIGTVGSAHFGLHRYRIGTILTNDDRFDKGKKTFDGRTLTVYWKVK